MKPLEILLTIGQDGVHVSAVLDGEIKSTEREERRNMEGNRKGEMRRKEGSQKKSNVEAEGVSTGRSRALRK